jgi:hypothetical protein
VARRRSQTTVDARNLFKRIAATKKVAEAARQDAGFGLGAAFVVAVEDLTPKDTNRLVRGWIEAGNDAGVTSRPLPPLEKSERYDEYMAELEEQRERYEKEVKSHASMKALYERQDTIDPVRKDGTPRKKRTRQPYYKKITKRLRKAEKRLARVEEEIAKALGNESTIFFSSESYVNRKRNQAFTTVRDTVYGGEGRSSLRSERLVVELRNLEPHGNIVEANPNLGHPVASALEIVRASGLRASGDVYRRILREGSPLGSLRGPGSGSNLGARLRGAAGTARGAA